MGILERLGLRRARPTAIADLEPGKRAWVEGVAFGLRGPIPAPFSGDEAASFTVVQHQLLHSGNETAFGRTGPAWRAVNDIDFGGVFYLRGETGVVRVDRQGWSVLKIPRRRAATVSSERRRESLSRFREHFAGDPLLNELQRVGLDSHVREVRNVECVVRQGAKIRVFGKVRRTGEPIPSGGVFAVRASGLRESSTLLEMIPGDKKLKIELA